MPEITPPQKVQATRDYGHIVLVGKNFDEACVAAQEAQRSTGALLRTLLTMNWSWRRSHHRTGNPEELPDVQNLLIPVGGGGLIAGMAAAIRERSPHMRIIGVEFDGSLVDVGLVRGRHPR